MFLATTNKAKRLLHLSYIGHVRAGEIQRGREESKAMFAELPEGFRVLADFERMESMDAEGVTELGKIMELADRKGVSLVVRVIPDPSKDVGLNILAAFHYRK